MKLSHLETSTYSNIMQVLSCSTCKVYHIEDFAQCGTYTAIRSELVRLEQKNILVRLARGIYMCTKEQKYHSTAQLIELILEDYKERFNIEFYPTGKYLLFKIGFVTSLPTQIDLSYNNTYPRKINLFGKYHIEFKHSSYDWINKIDDLDLKYLFVLLTTKWRGSIQSKKDDMLKKQISRIDKTLIDKYINIIPKRFISRFKSICDL